MSQTNGDKKYYLGIDAGSVSVDFAILDPQGGIIEDHYIRAHGQPVKVVRDFLQEMRSRHAWEKCLGVATTGSGGRLLADLLDAVFVNELISQSRATSALHPDVRTIIELGGEDSKLIMLEQGENGSADKSIADFATNAVCAAGTGSFLDQQANRLGIKIEGEFGELAMKSENPPRIAGRCSVFAKSDMIHLQQIATPDYDIVAGLCFAVARNFKSAIAKGKKVRKPFSFQGGVAANRGMVRAFREIFELADGEMVIPKHYGTMGAIGCALQLISDGGGKRLKGVEEMDGFLGSQDTERKGLARLSPRQERYGNEGLDGVDAMKEGEENIPVYVGIDIGSVSTNVVVMAEDGRLLSKRYLSTAGRPIEAVQQGLKEVGDEVGGRVVVEGVGTTGSGRYLINDFVGGDVVKNEITAQATAAVAIDPSVDTIFEIGGQDSKYISLDNGVVVDFEMNKVCAAGTGSFLEEQAEKLDLNIKKQFGEMACDAEKPCRFGDRCTVFMETDLVHHQQRGARKEDMVAGLAYSIVHNYLNKVVADKRVGDNIFFQGGTAANRGAIAAFEQVTGKKITVPRHHEVTGAIGIAMVAREHMEEGQEGTNFRGFDLFKREYSLKSFVCKACANVCEVRQVSIAGESPLYYGHRCEKWDIKEKDPAVERIPDLFRERQELLLNIYPDVTGGNRPRLGIPRALIFYEFYPLWKAFFSELGFEVVLSDATNTGIISCGVEDVLAETCFPFKVLHGHVVDLMKKKVAYIFLPSIINNYQGNPRLKQTYNCPYVQAMPYLTEAALDFEAEKVKVIKPALQLKRGRVNLVEKLVEVGKTLGRDKEDVYRALEVAEAVQQDFYMQIRRRGQEVLDGLADGERALVIVSRPYNGCDDGINLRLPRKLREMGVLAIPMDFLELDGVDISDEWPNMYWRYGAHIMSAARRIKEDKRLHAVYITNFGCGPDSFICKFFRHELAGKPFLQIEIDEHSADAGAITRLEAFLDSLANIEKEGRKEVKTVGTGSRIVFALADKSKRTIYFPSMANHAVALTAAFRGEGFKAEVLPPSDERTLELGRRYTVGKECYPAVVTTGDVVRKVLEPDFDRDRSAFFMASTDGPCRFGQYKRLQRLVLDELGYGDVPLMSLEQGKMDSNDRATVLDLSGDFLRRAWRGVVATDAIDRLARERRPYELNPGETDRAHAACLKIIETAVEAGNLLARLPEIRRAFTAIEYDDSVRRPVVGVVGEIFVRLNAFANMGIEKRLESLGAEVMVAPMCEWHPYTNWTHKRESKYNRQFFRLFKFYLKGRILHNDEHVVMKHFHDMFGSYREPKVEVVLKNGAFYLDDTYEGEAILSLGKAVDFARQGLSGVVSCMPFTCMPGTVVDGLLKKFREDYDNIPVINMAFDGQEDANITTRLEAFMYQVKSYQRHTKEAIEEVYVRG